MLLKVYSVYDSKVEAYLPPLYFKSKGDFLRSFAEAANDVKSNIGKYPSDYTAFEVGEWDDSTCAFKFHKALVSLGTAIEFVRQAPVSSKSYSQMTMEEVAKVRDESTAEFLKRCEGK